MTSTHPTTSVATSDHRHASWGSTSQIALAVLAGEWLAVLLYCLATPRGQHRSLIETVALLSAFVLLAALPASFAMVTRNGRHAYALSAALASGLALAICVHLDGGIRSPLFFLLALPVVASALTLPAWGTAALGVAGALELTVVSLVDPSLGHAGGEVLVGAGLLVGLTLVALVSAQARTRLESLNDALLGQLDELADTDPLTGCLNDRVFTAHLEAEIDRSLRYGEPLSLLIADVDGFSQYNETFGHAAGDAVLVGVGSLLQHLVRTTDVVARVGGDRFAVLMPSTTLEDNRADGAGQVARRVIAAVATSDRLGIALSVGLAALDIDTPSAERMLEDAEAALAEAKREAPAGLAVNPPPGVRLMSLAPEPVRTASDPDAPTPIRAGKISRARRAVLWSWSSTTHRSANGSNGH